MTPDEAEESPANEQNHEKFLKNKNCCLGVVSSTVVDSKTEDTWMLLSADFSGKRVQILKGISDTRQVKYLYMRRSL